MNKTIEITCVKCGKVERIPIDPRDQVYMGDILKELGWRKGLCPKCQSK